MEKFDDIKQNVTAFNFDAKTRRLNVLNQLKLPQAIEYVDVPDSNAGYSVIKSMMVRGAPCIAAVGCLSIIAELHDPKFMHEYGSYDGEKIIQWLNAKCIYMNCSRPTAVNLSSATSSLMRYARDQKVEDIKTTKDFIENLTAFCLNSLDCGLTLNRRLGDYGATEVLARANSEEVSVLTHCNTGSLATVGYGTALGVIRSLHAKKGLKRAYCTETRPYNQGSRLTAWELVREDIPATLIADSMVAYLMATHNINAVLVGADCVAANGDTANKIGTLQLAVVAKHYGVPFYVAAPTRSIDLTKKDGTGIEIEQRPPEELRNIGSVALAPEQVDVWNPCFDVTPSELITGGIITESGVCKASEIDKFVANCAEKLDLCVALF